MIYHDYGRSQRDRAIFDGSVAEEALDTV